MTAARTTLPRRVGITVEIAVDGKVARAESEVVVEAPTPSSLALLLTALDAAEGAVAAEGAR